MSVCLNSAAEPSTVTAAKGRPQWEGEVGIQTLWDSCRQLSISDSSPVTSSAKESVDSESPAVHPALSVVGTTSVASASLQLQPPSHFNSSRVSSSPASLSSTHSQQTVWSLGSVAVKARGPNKMSNYKVALNTYCQKKGYDPPRYDCTFPEDDVGYIATVHVNGEEFTTSDAEGTKRGAESTAAALALRCFGESIEASVGSTTNGHSVMKNGHQMEPAPSVSGENMTV